MSSKVAVWFETLRALERGRVLSNTAKWPFHFSEVETDIIPNYLTALYGGMMELEVDSTYPTSPVFTARLWKSCYAAIRSGLISGAKPENTKLVVEMILRRLEMWKTGGIFNQQGTNKVISQSKFNEEYLELSEAVELRSALRMISCLYSWSEAIAFIDHTNHHELHGPYKGRDEQIWYVHSFDDLNNTLSVNTSGIRIPVNRCDILMAWSGVELDIEVFNNVLNSNDPNLGVPVSARVLWEKNSVRISDNEISSAVIEMCSWIEKKGRAFQVQVFHDGLVRRTIPIFGSCLGLQCSNLGNDSCILDFSDVELYMFGGEER